LSFGFLLTSPFTLHHHLLPLFFSLFPCNTCSFICIHAENRISILRNKSEVKGTTTTSTPVLVGGSVSSSDFVRVFWASLAKHREGRRWVGFKF
ncbi:hypothetical protein VIGAN_09225000, partial [Vigna angularis var. angularis]